jgi:hypothetical protein
MNFPFLAAKERLIRIMGTFDLATGHADTFNELLDSLESELRDVLGHYREQRKWVGLTQIQVKLLREGVEKESIKTGDSIDWAFYTHINEALKEKNT